ncbi:nodulin MtN21 /EamA-like transporter family protein [Artemisia annua]|uniref:Nodulin MtN21 /EamA-like transporter family protein n=2 Tax=Artemisia annua TaxID=35608 RepID=A0A2U1QK62_ARTAN|nr:nodulin MtN21 /EamA-like transporter family protein [Artemisia annua]
MGEGQGFQLGTVGALGLSVISSVSIVICNKALISTLGFTFVFRDCCAAYYSEYRMLGPEFCDLGCFKRGKKMGEGQGFQLGTVGALGLSVISSVSIVICNKALISTLGFTFATTLTSWHLLVTFCSLHVALWMKFFEHKPFDSRAVMGFGILNGISIGLLNLCLGFNSVGFYQMTKLAIIPCTVLLETLFFSKQFSKKVRFSLAVLLLGVGIATVTDLQLNLLGSVLSLLAIITTCVAQIMTNTIQKKFKVSSTQLLYQSCPYQALILFIVGPFLDALLTNQNVFSFKYTPQVLVFIVLSCLISVSVNFSTFLVIGKTSPVTYQVLGHLKTCLVLAFGYVLLHDPFSWRNILGILIAVVGMGLYSYFCTRDTQPKPTETTQNNESENDPLINVESGVNVSNEVSPQKPPAWNSDKDLHA